MSIEYITSVAEKLIKKYGTRDPFRLCWELGIKIRYMDFGTEIKAFYFCKARIRNIILNSRVSKIVQKILAAHELGHALLHKEIAMSRGFKEYNLLEKAVPTEYEANVFASELLIDDEELLELMNNRELSFFRVASSLYVPAGLLDFKFRILKQKGYRFEAPIITNGDFLKNDVTGCYDDDY